jgi:hypothetical protein
MVWFDFSDYVLPSKNFFSFSDIIGHTTQVSKVLYSTKNPSESLEAVNVQYIDDLTEDHFVELYIDFECDHDKELKKKPVLFKFPQYIDDLTDDQFEELYIDFECQGDKELKKNVLVKYDLTEDHFEELYDFEGDGDKTVELFIDFECEDKEFEKKNVHFKFPQYKFACDGLFDALGFKRHS